MTSFLIDALLVAALAFTSWRTSLMHRELRRLRSERASFEALLEASDVAITRAASAVVDLRSNGIAALRELEDRTEEARAQTERLTFAIRAADLRFALQDASDARPTPMPVAANAATR